MMMHLGTLLIAFLSISAVQAAEKDCRFVSRTQLESAFTAFDASVIGLASCIEAFPELNAYYVGKFETLNETGVRRFVGNVAKIVDGTATTFVVKWESKQPLETRQMIVETQSPPNPSRPRVDVMSHYSFVKKTSDGHYLVFVTMLDPKSFDRAKPLLAASNRMLSTSGRFAASVSK